MNPTQSETPRVEAILRAASSDKGPRKYVPELLELACQMERELASLKSPELTGDMKEPPNEALIYDLAMEAFPESTGHRLACCCALRKMLSELSQHYEAMMAEREWRPISSAPKDGTRILCLWITPNGPVTDVMCKEFDGWTDPSTHEVACVTPDYWFPIPEARL